MYSQRLLVALCSVLILTVAADGDATSHNSLKSKLPRPGVCGVNLADRIIGGQKTALNAYPWTVLLIAQPTNGNSQSYSCGGSLISDQYVLTAAHCFRELPPGFNITKVRLGEWDLLSEEDCVDGVCADKPIDIDVGSAAIHEDYDSVDIHNDIALIKLSRKVSYTDFISPVCLPLSISNNEPDSSKNFTVVGWGATERGQERPGVFGNRYKLEVVVPGVDLDECKKTYPRLIDSELCAGGELLKDSCSGDSGGCLAAHEDDGYWYQYGVVSYGRGCGRRDTPGVYARVTSFLSWIDNHMEVAAESDNNVDES
ncbi:CLIP domain-containing serine protease B4-like [Sabethes cyaneus]|uniref:CLIP domain-containing serine protease B4-like n=1 Tax=Sabethes cyaneus TaxID=53552 RepID=UPI00237DF511|nr:CLIP domain-containing serine protease B4-like [Sabethes cyaneus]